MTLIADRFTQSATRYDEFACIQKLVAAHLASYLPTTSKRILEIGCGTGGFSSYLVKRFPDSEIILTDISSEMLKICRSHIGDKPSYRLIDAENLPPNIGFFDLIVSSLALQWVYDLRLTLKRLIELLNPGGKLIFAVLGEKNFMEWSSLLEKYDAASGLHHYPSAEDFCWPTPFQGKIDESFIQEKHKTVADFLKSLKMIGAGTAKSGHKSISPAVMKRILQDSMEGFTVSYHVLYGELTK